MLYPFFELSSVALAYKGNFLANPAGLGYGGREFSILYQDTTIIGNFSLFNTGIYFGRVGNSNFYGISSGYNISGVYIGAGYDITSKSYNIGLLLRNYRFLSLGGVMNIVNGKTSFSAGVGIRPYKEYITLYADALNIKRDTFNWKVGAYIQPIAYLGIRGEIRDNGEIFGGIELSYSKLRLGLSSPLKDIKKPSFGLLVSDKPFTEKAALKSYYYKAEVGSYTEDGREGFFGKGETFYDFIKSVKEAADNPRVKTIYLDLTDFGLSSAQADELRKILEYAKERGKEIISFAEGYGLGSYYVASVGKVYMAPEGDFEILGPYAEVEFLKGTLDKLGIKVQVFRVGKYKSAVEPLIQDTLSEANREQIKRLLETTWDVWLDRVSKGRGIPRDSLENIIKNYGYLSGEEAVKFGLIDGLVYYDQIKEKVKGIGFKGEERVDSRAWKKDVPKIAIVVAEGSIVDGESSFSPIPLIGGKSVGSKTIKEIFEEIRKDKSIKGVVLRVNSPGGSGLASDIMAREIKLTDEKKPVVVSMGGVAASGGYYISAPARKIFLDERTITGSIGVFGLKPVLGGFFSKIGMNREVVKLYPHSDAYSTWREMDSTELRRAQELVDYFYWRFVRHVAKGRNLPEDSVHSLAQGRVWSGVDAVKIGLADGFGGILDAIEYVKREAKIGDEYEVVIYPKQKGLFDRFKEMFNVGEVDYKGLRVMYRMEYELNPNF
ncbi:MAG: signal peptide peptidase SppA [candidate division WOR-3 bacterium]